MSYMNQLIMNSTNATYLILGWLIYSIFVVSGECENWIEEYDDGWYIMETYREDYETTYPDIYDGPFSLNEAKKWIDDCYKESQVRIRAYGTIYNLMPSKVDYFNDSGFFYYILRQLIFYLFMFGPPILLYNKYIKNK